MSDGPLPGLPSSHMTSHDWVYENLIDAGARFGYVPTVVQPVENGPGHIAWHNAALTDLQALAEIAGQTYVTPLPPVAVAGNKGHEQDHVYLQEASDEVLEWDAFNAATGGTESTINLGGYNYRLHEFTANGNLVVTNSAQPFVVLMTGGGNGANYYAGTYSPGSQVLPSTDDTDQEISLQNMSYPIVIGAGGRGGQNNAQPGGVTTAFGYTMQPGRSQVPVTNSITGTDEQYGGAGNYPDPLYGRGGIGQPNAGTAGQQGYLAIRYRIA